MPADTVNGGIVPIFAGPPGDDFPTGQIQCFDFVAPDQSTAVFNVENSFPGGAPRTPGYWKNWNRCSGSACASAGSSLQPCSRSRECGLS